MKSQGEIEAAVCEGVSRFQQESIGRGPRDIHCHLLGSLVVVRLQGVLTPAERLLLDQPAGDGDAVASVVEDGAVAVASGHAQSQGNGQGNGNGNGHGNGNGNGHGRALVKQVRHQVMTSGRPRLRQIVENAVGVRLVSVHHDISTVTGEEVLVFTLSDPPACRSKKRE